MPPKPKPSRASTFMTPSSTSCHPVPTPTFTSPTPTRAGGSPACTQTCGWGREGACAFVLAWLGLGWVCLVWFGLVWSGLGCFNLVWSGLVWSGGGLGQCLDLHHARADKKPNPLCARTPQTPPTPGARLGLRRGPPGGVDAVGALKAGAVQHGAPGQGQEPHRAGGLVGGWLTWGCTFF